MPSRKKSVFKLFIILFTTIVCLEITAGPVLAAAPQVSSVEVSTTSAKITFNQEVVSNTVNDNAGPSSSAGFLGNYSLQSPVSTAQVLSRLSPYNQWTEYNGATNALKIYGLNLTQGQQAQFAWQNIQNTSAETIISNTTSTTVAASTDPRLNNITPLYAQVGNSITLEGVNLGDATSVVRIDAVNVTEFTNASSTTLTITIPVSLSASTDAKWVSVQNDQVDVSLSRPLYLYNTANYGIITGTIKDTDGTTAVDKVEVEAYTDENTWNRYSGQTQANGQFAIVVPAGTYNVAYTTPGFGSTGAAPSKSTGVVVTVGSVATVDGDASTAGTQPVLFVTKVVSGTVRAPDGTTPLYGTRVQFHNQSWTLEQNAITGVDGSYKIYVPASTSAPQYNIEITPSTYDQQVNSYLATNSTVNVSTAGQQYTKNISLATENVTGTVKTPTGDTSDSNPFPNQAVPSANIHLFKSDWSFDRWTSTDSNGTFKFSGVEAGTYSLELEPPYCGYGDANIAKFCVYARTRKDNITVAESGITNLNTSDAATDGAIRFSLPNFYGYVYRDDNSDNQYTAADDFEIANAWVNISRESFWTGTQTDANGRYAVNLPSTSSGRYYLNVSPSSSVYASFSEEFDIASTTLPHNIKLSTPNLQGILYGPSGTSEPQAWTWINTCPSSGWGTCYGGSTDQNGQFSLNLADGNWSLSIQPNWNSYYVAPGAKAIVVADNIVTSVAGDTNDSDEPLLTNRSVILRLVDPATDPNSLSGIIYGPLGLTPDVSSTPQTNIGISLREARQEGSQCWGEGMNSRWTQTNSQGRYAFADVEAGIYELEAMPWGSQYSRVRVCPYTISDSASRTKNLNLTAPNITGTVATPAGTESDENPTPDAAVQYAWVSLYQEGPSMGAGGGWYSGSTNESGVFSLGGVNPGTYTLEVSPGWGSAYSNRKYHNIQLADSDSDGSADAVNLNTLLGVASTNFASKALRVGTPNIKGRIMDPGADGNPATTADNQPVRWVWVMVHDATWMNNSGGNTDDNGYFRIGGLSEGSYQIEVNLPWGGGQALTAPTNLTVSIDASGVGTISGSNVSDNVITLSPPTKTITGVVYKDTNSDNDYDVGTDTLVADARVEAHRDTGGGYFETQSGIDGSYVLKVSGGSWWVETRPSWTNSQPDWVYTEPPTRITFAENESTELESLNFKVTAADATITGTVKTPTNEAVQWAWVDIRGNKGMGNGASTDNQGRFTVKVPAGTYNLMVFSSFADYGSPDPKSVTVASEQTEDAGTLYLKSKNSHIKGFVQDDTGNPLQNMVVNAWLFDGAGWAMDSTDQTGAYDLPVWAGTWGVMVMPMSQNYIYQGSPQKITITANETSSGNNFELKNANMTLKVKVVKSDNTRVLDIWGGAWVRDTSLTGGGMLDFGGPMEDIMQKAGMMSSGGGTAAGGGSMAPGMEKGGFTGGGLYNGYTEIKVPAGAYEVGLGMPPGSNYTLLTTQTVTVSSSTTCDDGDVNCEEVSLIVKDNDATISGVFYLDTNNDDVYTAGTDTLATGVRAFIHADREGGGWQSTESNSSTGGYILQVAGGDWFVDAFIDPWMIFGNQQYMVINDDTQTTVVDVADGGTGTATRNFKVKRLDATITGTVKNPDGTAMTSAGWGLVWVFADFGSAAMLEEFEGPGGPGLGTFTEADGTYSLKVPAGTYNIGAGIPPWDTRDLLNPDLINVTVAADQTSNNNHLQFKQSNATIAGTIYLDADNDGQVDTIPTTEAKAGFIRAWSDNNSGGGTVTLDGSYSLKVTQDDTWHIVAAAEINDAYYESEPLDISIVDATTGCDLSGTTLSCTGKNLALVSQGFTVLDGVSSSFDASQSKTIKLTKANGQDEVVLEIPAGAIATSGTITLSITPTVNVKPDSKDKPVGLAYSFEARDANGQKIEDFVQNITIYMYYDPTVLTAAGYSEDSITPKYYNDSTGSWENWPTIIRDTENNRFIIKTDHFSEGGYVGGNETPAAPSNLTATAQSTSSIALAWTDNSNNETSFKVYRGSTLITTTVANAVSYTDTGLSASTTYSYTVKAANGSGDSSASNTASATTLSGGGSSSSGSVVLQQPTPEKPTVKEPTVTKQPTTVVEKSATPVAKPSRAKQLENIISEAKRLAKATVAEVLELLGAKRDLKQEQTAASGLVKQIIGSLKATTEIRNALTNFITYGTPESQKLGSGERAGVVNSFKSAFGKLPTTDIDWADVLKIGAGRWPSQKSDTKEKTALKTFEKIYKHQANRKDAKEDAAVVIMAYGLRPSARNLASEKSAILSFKKIFNKQPTTSNDWDTTRAIAYSGASRQTTGKVLGVSVESLHATTLQQQKKTAISAVFNQNLGLGSSGADVSRLQELLSQDPALYPEATISGYFGPLTEKAVGRFQLKYQVVSSELDPGFGYLGPATRAKIAEVF